MKYITLISLLICFAACQSESKLEFDSVQYHFQDSSVPPEYHRSFTIILSKGSIEKLVDSYGDTISYENHKVDKTLIEEFRKVFDKAKIKKCNTPTDDEGCAGGTGIGIRCFNGKLCTFEASRYFCGGQQTGDLCGDTDQILKFLNQHLKK